jgi:hypothetical protein
MSQLVAVLTVIFRIAYFGPKAISKLEITEPCNMSLQKSKRKTERNASETDVLL